MRKPAIILPRAVAPRRAAKGLRSLAAAVLLLFVAGLASSFTDAICCASPNPAQASHAEGTSCPDTGDTGDPCGPGCPCPCCPVHRLTAAFATFAVAMPAPAAVALAPSVLGDLHPRDLGQRIFHPPRA